MTASPIHFQIQATDGPARAGLLATPHGVVQTPFFMVVGTAASVKGMTINQLRSARAQVLLANTYHLAIRPGDQAMAERGGLARFMGWDGPTLTDSGGYQVFSLARKRKITADGVRFSNHIDGRELMLTPEKAVAIQKNIGADMMMCLDICPPARSSHAEVADSLKITHAWEKRCREAWNNDPGQALFGIVQGAIYEDLRSQSVDALTDLDFPGYAIGGVAVGEDTADIRRIVSYTAPLLPVKKPRYLMGVGTPGDIIAAVCSGVDMFDCVMPTRHARHYQAFTRNGTLNLKNACHAGDDSPIESDCDCETCQTVGRAYLRHLAMLGELMASVWITIHNVRFYCRLMEELRQAILTRSLQSISTRYPGWVDEMV